MPWRAGYRSSGAHLAREYGGLVLGGARVAVIGAGQAGLAVSHELAALGVEHVVFERARVGQAWRDRWDSFCLVAPNWTMSLPDLAYAGDDPEGFVPRDEVVGYLERYASRFGAPVQEGIEIQSLEPGADGRFLLRTPAGELRAESVVVCTRAYQRAHRPGIAAAFPPGVMMIDAGDYHSPAALPPASPARRTTAARRSTASSAASGTAAGRT